MTPSILADAETVLTRMHDIWTTGSFSTDVPTQAMWAARRLAEYVRSLQLTDAERAAVDALRAADAARTPGPWESVELWYSRGLAVVMHHNSISPCGESVFGTSATTTAGSAKVDDADFIAAAGTHLTALLGYVERIGR